MEKVPVVGRRLALGVVSAFCGFASWSGTSSGTGGAGGGVPLLFAEAAVDDNGNVIPGADPEMMMPPPPVDYNESAVDDGPPDQEKIFKLLMYELGTYNSYKIPRFVNFYEYEDFQDLDCPKKLVHMTREFQSIADTVQQWHANFTGTAGLFYLVQDKQAPGIDVSWVWMTQHFQHRLQALLQRLIAWIQTFSISTTSHDPGCLYFMPGVRRVLVEFLTHYKRLQTDNTALLWNGVAFGMLGDVTRDDFEEWELTEQEKIDFGVANKTREQIIEVQCGRGRTGKEVYCHRVAPVDPPAELLRPERNRRSQLLTFERHVRTVRFTGKCDSSFFFRFPKLVSRCSSGPQKAQVPVQPKPDLREHVHGVSGPMDELLCLSHDQGDAEPYGPVGHNKWGNRGGGGGA